MSGTGLGSLRSSRHSVDRGNDAATLSEIRGVIWTPGETQTPRKNGGAGKPRALKRLLRGFESRRHRRRAVRVSASAGALPAFHRPPRMQEAPSTGVAPSPRGAEFSVWGGCCGSIFPPHRDYAARHKARHAVRRRIRDTRASTRTAPRTAARPARPAGAPCRDARRTPRLPCCSGPCRGAAPEHPVA